MPTPKPLRILVYGLPPDTEELKALEAKGHVVSYAYNDEQNDLIIGPQCWRLTPKLTKYLDLAVKEARRHRYGPRKGKTDDAEE